MGIRIIVCEIERAGTRRGVPPRGLRKCAIGRADYCPRESNVALVTQLSVSVCVGPKIIITCKSNDSVPFIDFIEPRTSLLIAVNFFHIPVFEITSTVNSPSSGVSHDRVRLTIPACRGQPRIGNEDRLPLLIDVTHKGVAS